MNGRKRYHRIDLLGKGGMGEVWLVRDEQLGSYWAMKQIRRSMQGRERAAFDKEVAMLTRLHHPAIPRIVDHFQDEVHDYVIMDLVEGSTVSKYIHLKGAMREEQGIEWMRQLLEILAYLHGENIIFQDIKLENMMISNQHISLIDFGIASKKEEVQIEQYGTHGYAAPELYCGMHADEKSDIYALGKSMMAILTGNLQVEEYDASILDEYEISEGMKKILRRCTMKDRSDRYDHVHQVLEDLRKVHHMKVDGIQKNRNERKMRKNIFLASMVLLLLSFICKGFYEYFYAQNYQEAMRNQEYERALSWKNKKEPYHQIYQNRFTKSFQKNREREPLEEAIAKAKRDTLSKMDDVNLSKGEIAKDYDFHYQLGKDCFLSNDKKFLNRAVQYYFSISLQSTNLSRSDIQSYQALAQMLGQLASLEKNAVLALRGYMKSLQENSESRKDAEEQFQTSFLLSQVYASFQQELEHVDFISWQNMLKEVLESRHDEVKMDVNVSKENIMILLHQWIDAFYYQGNLARYEKNYDVMNHAFEQAMAIVKGCEEAGYVDEALWIRCANMYIYMFQVSENKATDIVYLEASLKLYEKVFMMQSEHSQAIECKKDCERL